ncbi:hypothetical protein HZA71_01685 [Candidatus Falkowbacteria bacterium]|nr:hypothetical protein [Candidatus Falkowbacteria bacterium]
MFKSRPSPRQRSSITKILLVVFLVIFLFLILPTTTWAQNLNLGLESARGIGLGETPLKVIIARIVQIILGFLGILTVILIMYAGFIWMTAAGDERKIEKAKKILLDAIIGLIIILAAFIIVSFILRSWETGGGGGPGGRGPGGGPDLWGLGQNPVESVYPANRQRDVPINTMIAVTFKEKIKPSTICQIAENATRCNGEVVKVDGTKPNVEICKTQNNILDGDCEITGEFVANNFKDTKVYNVDDYTFVFITYNAGNRKYLGLEDKQNRVFRVTLQSGILKGDGSNKTVFENTFGKIYRWSFTTNGELDLDPPEVQSTNAVLNPEGIDNVSGIIPSPDERADTYELASAATRTQWVFTTVGSGSFNREIIAAATQPAPVSPNTKGASVSGTYSGQNSGLVTVTINGTAVSVRWPSGVVAQPYTTFTSTYDSGLNVNIGPYGLIFRLNEVAAGSNQWTFNVTAPKTGDRVQFLADGLVAKEYVIGKDVVALNPATAVGRTDTLKNIVAKILADYGAVFQNCTANPDLCLVTKNTGSATNRYAVKFLVQNTDNISDVFNVKVTAGQNILERITVRGVRDGYRNTKFQINFNEAVNPLVIDKILVKYDKDYDSNNIAETSIQNTADKINIKYKITNKYRTVELAGNIECGVNACGDKIYCWPVNKKIDTDEDGTIDVLNDFAHKATYYEVETPAANLKKCSTANEGWCKTWGGICTANGACSKTVPNAANQIVYYPKSIPTCQTGRDNSWCTGMGTNWSCNSDLGNKCTKIINNQIVEIYKPNDWGICPTANSGWCTAWGGSCKANAPCTKISASVKFYYPSLETPPSNGLTDMALNSFNGSFNYFQDPTNQRYYGLANGQEKNVYNLNLSKPYYNPSDPSGSGFGDNFQWSFWLSDKVDLQPPLLMNIDPIKDKEVDNLFYKPKLSFNKIMSMATLKPGWNYGQSVEERNKRYILLTPLRNAWAIGYNINSSNDIDSQDGEPKYTHTFIEHSSPFSVPASYAPLAGSGLESITQNCFLPGSGPQGASNTGGRYLKNGSIDWGKCDYKEQDGLITWGCVSDLEESNSQVKVPNPASYAALLCNDGEINGAKKCDSANDVCMAFHATSTKPEVSGKSMGGSWVISKDHATADINNKTGCCFGKCFDNNNTPNNYNDDKAK